jgi:hypothetical protein
MDKNRESAIRAASKANRHLSSAYRDLIGHRLPLAGFHCDREKALSDLRAAHGQIAEAIQLVESCPSSIESGRVPTVIV